MIERVEQRLIIPSSTTEQPATPDITDAHDISSVAYPDAPRSESGIEVVEPRLELVTDLAPETPEVHGLPPAPFRDEHTQRLYEEHAAGKHAAGDTSCDICRLVTEQLEEQKGMRGSKLGRAIGDLFNIGFVIVPNSFPYDTIDGQKVKKHDLLVPVKHFSERDKVPMRTRYAHARKLAQAMQTYDLYAERAPGNAASSIPGHKHGHLYELGTKMNYFMYDPAKKQREIKFPDDEPTQPDA